MPRPMRPTHPRRHRVLCFAIIETPSSPSLPTLLVAEDEEAQRAAKMEAAAPRNALFVVLTASLYVIMSMCSRWNIMQPPMETLKPTMMYAQIYTHTKPP